MRKALVIFIILLACGMAGLFPLREYLLSEKEQVRYEETVIVGDSELTKGVTVELRSQMNHRHFWDSDYKIGAGPETETEYQYYSSRYYENVYSNRGDGVQFVYFPNFGSSGGSLDRIGDSIGFGKAYEMLAEETQAGTTGTMTFRISDYYTYYPVWLSIGTERFEYDYSGVFWANAREGAPEEEKEAVNQAFSEFFRIPVLKDEVYTISITKNANGAVTDVQGEPGAWGTSESIYDGFFWETVSAWDEECFYFTFVPYSNHGKEMNTEQISGGFGIYRLPYYLGEDGMYHIKAEELVMMYPLEKEMTKKELYLMVDAVGDLLVVTGDAEDVVFTVIDPSAGTKKQTLTVERPSEEELRILHTEERFMVCLFGSEHLLVVDWNEEHGYRNCFVTAVEQDSLIGQAARSYRHVGDYDWNGEQLLYATYGLAEIEEVGAWPGRVYDTDFSVAVYDESGEIYLAEYRSSLYTEEERRADSYEYRTSDGRCLNDSALEVEWGK